MNGRVLLLAAALIGPAATGAAQTKLGEFGDWTAYANKDADGKMCVAAAEPSESAYSQPIKGRDAVMFFLARFPSKNARTEASAAMGYPVAPNAKVTVKIDGSSTFTMFTETDTAWAEDGQDAALVNAMRRGKEMIVQGTSRRGTVTTDTYSLAGVTAAVNAIAKECP